MNPDPQCIICGRQQWEPIGSRTYRAADGPSSEPYTRLRYEVLFTVWHPGHEDFTIRFVMCRGCGFITYLPRPTAADVEAKYRRLAESGDTGYTPSADEAIERVRADRLYARLRRVVGDRCRRVLDYGGGNGAMLQPFVRAGHECSVVDYAPEPVPGVKRLGDTAESIPSAARFDLVICSHVLEHLADPGKVLSRLREHLDTGGLLFAEVPVEIWKGAPRLPDPVTHINFFTLSSLELLLQRHGFSPLRSRTESYADPRWCMTVAVAVARKADAAATGDYLRGVAETRALLNPSPAMKLRRILMHPRTLLHWAVHGRLCRPQGPA